MLELYEPWDEARGAEIIAEHAHSSKARRW